MNINDNYIECNFHWTHENHFYKGSLKDKTIIKNWKNKNSKFYDNALKTWTKRDVEKRNCALKNNLNYLVFFDLKSFSKYFEV